MWDPIPHVHLHHGVQPDQGLRAHSLVVAVLSNSNANKCVQWKLSIEAEFKNGIGVGPRQPFPATGTYSSWETIIELLTWSVLARLNRTSDLIETTLVLAIHWASLHYCCVIPASTGLKEFAFSKKVAIYFIHPWTSWRTHTGRFIWSWTRVGLT